MEKVFPVLEAQKSSFTALLAPFIVRIYGQGKAPDSMMNAELRKAVSAATGYELDENEAQEVLKKESLVAINPHDPHVFASESAPEEIHSGKLAKTLSNKNFCVWATGTHTATDVPVWAVGPKSISEKFSGSIDNTDIAKLIGEILVH